LVESRPSAVTVLDRTADPFSTDTLNFFISILINCLNLQPKKRSSAIESTNIYTSGRYHRLYSIGIKDIRFLSRRRSEFSFLYFRTTRSWSIFCRDICDTKSFRRDICETKSLRRDNCEIKSLRRDICEIKSLRRGMLCYQLRSAGECCVNKFSLAAISSAIVLCVSLQTMSSVIVEIYFLASNKFCCCIVYLFRQSLWYRGSRSDSLAINKYFFVVSETSIRILQGN